MTGKTTTRNRSTRLAFSRERHTVRLPMVRIGLEPLAFISRTASTGPQVTSCVFAQARGSLKVVEKTTFDMPASAAVPAALCGKSRHQTVSGRAHQDGVVRFGLLSQPCEVLGAFQSPKA